MNSLGRTMVLGLVAHRHVLRAPQALVLTPNSRAARVLGVPARTLESHATALLVRAGRGIAEPYVAHCLLRDAVREAMNPADPDGLTRTVRPALGTLFRANADLGVLTRNPSARIQALGRIARAYRDRLRQRNLVDRAEVLTEAAKLPFTRAALLVYGYPRLGMDELGFLDAAAGPGSLLYLPYEQPAGSDSGYSVFGDNEAARHFLEGRGWTCVRPELDSLDRGAALVRSFLTETQPGGVVQAQVYATVEAEVRGALAQVKALLVDGTAPEEIVVVARDDAFYGPTALAVAWEFGLPLRALYAIPLVETRVGSWLRLALEVARDDFPYEPTLRLLGHPLGPGIKPELWKVIRRRRPGGLAEWEATGVDLSGVTWPARDLRGAYVQRLRELIQNEDVRNQAAPWAREMLAYNMLWENLGELENPADASRSFETFVSDVGEVLGLLTVPMAPGRVGVELHTPLSLYGARYKHVFALGLAEGMFPQPVQDDLVLDFHDRKRLLADGVALEAPASAAAREQLSFVAMLLATTDHLTLSYPQLVGDQAGLPSLFLRALKLDQKAERSPLLVASAEELRRICLRWEGDGRASEDHVAQQAHRAWVVERRRESSDPPDEYDGVPGETLDPEQWRFSASQLVEIGQCAFKWFAARVLRLAESDEAAPNLPPNRRGDLYHKTLELGLKRAGGNGGVREALLVCLDEVFAEAEAELKLPRLPAWPAQRATHLLVLRRAIEGSDFVHPDAEVARKEGEFAGEWHGLWVTGRVDRVDRTPAGLVLIDYKASGSAPAGAQNDQGQARLDVQLPLYREVAAPSFFPGESVVDAYYYSLTKAEKLPVAASDEAAQAALVERVKGYLSSGSYPVAPDVDQKACTYCPYDSVCRRGPRLLRKRAAAP